MDAGGRHPRPGFASCLTETFMLRADGELYALLPGEYNKDFFMVGSDYTVYAQEETDEEVSWELRTGGDFAGAARITSTLGKYSCTWSWTRGRGRRWPCAGTAGHGRRYRS